jgi:hypothetical protein
MATPAPVRRMSDEQFSQLRERYLAGESREDLARAFGYSVGALFDRRREERGKGLLAHPGCRDLPRLQGRGGGRGCGADYSGRCVSLEEREARKAEIQAGWTPEERAARRYPGPPEDRRVSNSRRGWDNFEPARGFASARRMDTRPRRNW